MPPQRKQHGKDGDEGSNGSKERCDLNRLARADEIGGKILEHILKLVCARSGIVCPTRKIGNLLQSRFIDLPAKTTSPNARTKSSTAKEIILLELISTIHDRIVAIGAKPDRIHAYPAFQCLLGGTQRGWTSITRPIG